MQIHPQMLVQTLCSGWLLKVSLQLVCGKNKEMLFIYSQGLEVFTRFLSV